MRYLYISVIFFGIYYFFGGKVARTGRYLPRGLTECHQCGGRVKVGVNSGHVVVACAVAFKKTST